MDPRPLVLDPAGTDIQAEAARIRERGPVTQVELPGGVLAWSVSDADTLRGLLIDSRVSKDARQHWPAFINGEISHTWSLFLWVAVTNMFTAYGGDHRRLRKLVAPAFTHRRTSALRPRIEEITGDLLANLAATAPGEVADLREDFAYPLPIQVITDLMGVPDSLGPGLRKCVDGIFDTSLTPEEATANYGAMYQILGELVEIKRDKPADDMTSLLISTRDEDDGSSLTEQELVDTLLLVISAGHETTVNLLDQAIHALITHPVQLAHVYEGRASWDDVIEESLRFEAPVANLPLRFAVEDIDVDGIVIPKGDAILASFAAAGRGSKPHGDSADTFDVTRPHKDHVAFGYGVHHCLGAPLARLEAAVALPALFERFPDMRLADEALEPVPSFISNGHRRLPVVLVPKD
ncbi:cytochrome P450 [Phytomonospora sp. NPDC050363]|uniref:cytochrome P450 family protein n=1 Tax=Phytomonospora sp. NPDC050363 TaxID=3155642 RepID=UPI0033D2F885